MKKEINVLLIIVCIFLFTFYSCIQNTSLTKSDTGIGEDILEIAKTLDENRIMKQSEILDCGELPGTFWVTAEPDIIDGKQYYFYGYIFLDRNYMIIVQVEQIHKTDKLFELGLSPVLYINKIYGMVPYDIIENKIIIDNDVFGYLQDTFLYFDIGVGYKKYLLWDWFSIKNKEGELINSKIYW